MSDVEKFKVISKWKNCEMIAAFLHYDLDTLWSGGNDEATAYVYWKNQPVFKSDSLDDLVAWLKEKLRKIEEELGRNEQ